MQHISHDDIIPFSYDHVKTYYNFEKFPKVFYDNFHRFSGHSKNNNDDDNKQIKKYYFFYNNDKGVTSTVNIKVCIG